MTSARDPLLKNKFATLIREKKCTLFAVGPVSLNCVNAAIELSQEYDFPLILIASRRQIDSGEHGGGYVNNWTTEEFSEYVKAKNKSGQVFLARDHGWPWQNTLEIDGNFSLERAMESAKKSYQTDISAGFSFLHLDPSVDIHGNPSNNDVLNRVFELYEYCAEAAAEQNREVIFEIGTEEQSGGLNSIEALNYLLDEIHSFCKRKSYHLPMFVVVQTGTRVMETRNTGSLEQSVREKNGGVDIRKRISGLIELCGKRGMYVKAHNADYLSSEAIGLHPELGIHAANVAPEFGVTETKTFVQLLEQYSLNHLTQQFLELSYLSKKWEKWMIKDTQANDRDRAIISGHYVFSTREFKRIKKEAENHLVKKDVILDQLLKERIKKQMMRYIQGFNLV